MPLPSSSTSRTTAYNNQSIPEEIKDYIAEQVTLAASAGFFTVAIELDPLLSTYSEALQNYLKYNGYIVSYSIRYTRLEDNYSTLNVRWQ